MVNETTKERPGAPGAQPAMLDAALAQAEWMRLALVMLEGSRGALEFQRTMVDFYLEMLRRQQDAAFAAMRNAMQGGAPGVPGLGAGAGVDLVRLGQQTFEQMAEMMRGVGPGQASLHRRGTKGTP